MSISAGGQERSSSSIATSAVGQVIKSGSHIGYRLRQALSRDRLFTPVDTASIAAVRVVLGLLVAIDAARYGQDFFYPSGGVLPFQFRYPFFHWVQESPELSVYLPYVLFVSGIALAIGFLFRFFSVFCLMLFAYGFLLRAEYYLNHFYMLIIMLFLLSISPAHRSFSIDKLLFSNRDSFYAPKIYLLLFKAQVEIILIYAGLVKINSDWLQLEPLRTWLHARQNMAFVGDLWQSDLVVAVGAYGTILLHIVGAPLLLFARTRLAVFLIYCVFHITNHFVFNIGIFPWMTIACTTLFFAPDWPRRVLDLLSPSFLWRQPKPVRQASVLAAPRSIGTHALIVFAACWVSFQALFPLRHLLYPGWVEWTDEGDRFAWRMKLTDRRSPGLLLAVHIPDLNTVHVPSLERYLSRGQYRRVSTIPYLTQELALQVARLYKDELQVRDVEVFAYAPATLNNRQPALLIDPTVDLAATRPTLWHDAWVTKYNPNPLRRIEEVSVEELRTKRDLQQVLSSMGFPKPRSCYGPGATKPRLIEDEVCLLNSGK